MHSPSNWYIAKLGRVPSVVSLTMLFNFLRCLPRPFVGGPVAYGRQMIQDALAAVNAFGPRDRLEAMLVMQIPVLQVEADTTFSLAQRETDWECKARMQRHAMALSQRPEALGAEVRRHRGGNWRRGTCSTPHRTRGAYDLDALEAV